MCVGYELSIAKVHEEITYLTEHSEGKVPALR